MQTFPDLETGRWQISTSGGEWPAWNPAADELFYRDAVGVMVQAFAPEPTFTRRSLTRLFERELVVGRNRRMAVSPDGQRLLVLVNAGRDTSDDADGDDPAEPLVIVVQNWFEELRRLVPTE